MATVERAPAEPRRGSSSSETRRRLIDVGRRLLVEEGVAALTARRLAQEVGLSHQIAHYYFRTIEELLVLVVAETMDEVVDEIRAAIARDEPLSVVLAMNSTLRDVAMGNELIIEAATRPALRATVNAAIRRFRDAQIEAVSAHFARLGKADGPSAPIATVVATSVLRVLTLERAIGVDTGHAETVEWLGALLGVTDLADRLSSCGRFDPGGAEV